jgi:TRAP-type transport system small permease protein
VTFGKVLHHSLGMASALVLAGLALLTFVDVVGRYLFNQPVRGAYEVIEMLMGVLIFTALPVVTHSERHITIDLLDTAMPRRLARLRDITVNLICAIALGIIAWRLWLLGDVKAAYNDLTSFLRIPQAPVVYAISVLAACASICAALLSLRLALKPA